MDPRRRQQMMSTNDSLNRPQRQAIYGIESDLEAEMRQRFINPTVTNATRQVSLQSSLPHHLLLPPHHPHPHHHPHQVMDELDVDVADHPEDHIYNQYEKIDNNPSTRNGGTSTDSNSSSGNPSTQTTSNGQTGSRNDASGGRGSDIRPTHYAESAIYDRSRDTEKESWPSSSTIRSACLVKTQSSTRIILPSDMDSYLNSSVIRGPNSGIITSRTVGTNKSRGAPAVSAIMSGGDMMSGLHVSGSLLPPISMSSHHYPTSMTNSISSRLSKRFPIFGRFNGWKILSAILFVTCVTLTFCLFYAISLGSSGGSISSSGQTGPCVMIGDSSSSSSPQQLIPSSPHLVSPLSCPNVCSGRGQYFKGSCICPDGWKGPECDVPGHECEVADCHGHGTCIKGSCQCRDGFGGRNCEMPTSAVSCDCSGRGSCLADGSCRCHHGYRGSRCEIADCHPDPDCSSNGVCFEGRCLCKPGFKGDSCSSMTNDRNDHQDQSTSVSSKTIPTCAHGHVVSGDDCTLPRCPIDCGSHGLCHKSGSSWSCLCDSGWTGSRCDLRTACDPRCKESGHGRCSGNGTCICSHGYFGEFCGLTGCPNSCSGPEKGDCISSDDVHDNNPMTDVPFKCQCKAGWAGRDCSLPVETECTDGLDNDRDGLTDCADNDCCSKSECRDSPLCLSSPEPLDILLRKPPPPVTASFFERMKFLIEDGSVQSYAHGSDFVESLTSRFIPSRASVIRGQIVSPSGSGLMGIRVGVANEPSLGFVVSRESGWFDFMVNGGSAVVLQFQREPFRITERTYYVPWNEIVVVDPVVMALASAGHADHPSSVTDASAKGTSSCDQHIDYPLMKPSMHATWKYCPCHEDGHLADGKILDEQLPIPGTEMYLVYNSTRASGFKSVIDMTLTPRQIPSTLRMVHVKVRLEGNSFDKVFEAEPNLRWTYSWNRRNVYRQKVYGVANAIISIGYEYNSCPSIMWKTSSLQLPAHDLPISEIGGWNLNIHHRYNFHEGILHKGDGINIYLKPKRPRVASPTAIVADSSDSDQQRVKLVKPFLPQPNKSGEYEIISQDTMEVYIFNKHGLHVHTKSAINGKFLFNFSYVDNTSFGKLSSVTNVQTGNRVQLLRDYSNQVKEIETSNGSKCRLEMSRTRSLESYVLPDNSKVHFTYNGQTGLIKSKSNNTSGVTFTFDYDKNGRIVKAVGPDGKSDLKCSEPF